MGTPSKNGTTCCLKCCKFCTNQANLRSTLLLAGKQGRTQKEKTDAVVLLEQSVFYLFWFHRRKNLGSPPPKKVYDTLDVAWGENGANEELPGLPVRLPPSLLLCLCPVREWVMHYTSFLEMDSNNCYFTPCHTLVLVQPLTPACVFNAEC